MSVCHERELQWNWNTQKTHNGPSVGVPWHSKCTFCPSSGSSGPHPRQRFSTATAMCSQIAVAVDGLPTHAATDLSQFQLSQLNRSPLIVTMSDLASDDQIAHQISENSDQQQPPPRPASCGGGCWSPYTGNLVEVAVGNCGCGWKSLSWMGPFRAHGRTFQISTLLHSTPCLKWVFEY